MVHIPREGTLRFARFEQRHPAYHGADPGVTIGVPEHEVGIRVRVSRLHQHGGVDSRGPQLRLQLGRLKGALDGREVGGEPRVLDKLEVPEVLMRVYSEWC